MWGVVLAFVAITVIARSRNHASGLESKHVAALKQDLLSSPPADEPPTDVVQLSAECNSLNHGPSDAACQELKPLLPFRGVGAPPPLSETPCMIVSTREQLDSAARNLEGAPWVAVDVEHNSARSYFGVSCLLQLSTGDADYIVDTLALHDDMALLQPLFNNPRTLKIFHGAGNDMIWLQRDFQLHVKACFDTLQAAQVLGMKLCSLGHLLVTLLGITTDKSFQLADWRLRPLPEEAITYARTDVHWLAQLAAVLVQNLEKIPAGDSAVLSPVQRVWQKSQAVAAVMYHEPTPSDAAANAATSILRKQRHEDGMSAPAGDATGTALPAQGRLESRTAQRSLLALCAWRDQLARSVNEGIQYVAPDRLLLALLDAQPSSTVDVQQLSDGLSSTVGNAALQNLRQHTDEICRIFSDAGSGEDLEFDAVHASREWGFNTAMGGNHRRPSRAEASRQKRVKKFSAQSAVYENCRILAENGAPLCFCDRRKLDWYVERGLAERISEKPPTVRLLFEHKNADRLNDKDLFYSASKKNQCVVCGTSDHYLRYRVIPAAYRKHLPLHFKSHRSHDIVLLCVDCHEHAQLTAEGVKRKLALEYAVPLLPPWQASGSKAGAFSATGEAAARFSARSAATALISHGSTMPLARRTDLERAVRECCALGDEDSVSHENLLTALVAGLPAKKQVKALRRMGQEAPSELPALGPAVPQETGHIWHGRMLVEAAMAAGGEKAMFDICRRFRRAFKEELRPRHLPAGWDVDHDAKREFGAFSVYAEEGAE